MRNGERSSSGNRSEWPVKLGAGIGGVAGAAIALFVIKPLVELPFWLGLIAFVAVSAVGIVLGRLAGRLLFRASSVGAPEEKNRKS
jgi:hypothetical protein